MYWKQQCYKRDTVDVSPSRVPIVDSGASPSTDSPEVMENEKKTYLGIRSYVPTFINVSLLFPTT